MTRNTSKRSARKSAAKHYERIEPLIRVGNLLPWSVRNGKYHVEMAARIVSEVELPSPEVMRGLSQSLTQLAYGKELQKLAIERNKPMSVRPDLDMIPSDSQEQIFKEVYDRFSQCFAGRRIKIGKRIWNLAGDRLKVSRLYAAVRDTLSEITAARFQIGDTHFASIALPSAVQRLQIVWDDPEPAISVIPDPVLDVLREGFEGQDPRRIKRCPECGSFFFAQRRDRSACTPKCLNLARVHRHRAKQSQYEYARKLKQARVPKSD